MKTDISEAIINKLKAPLPAEAITQHPTKSYLSTIKAIYVVERFNEVFGLGGWYINNEIIVSEPITKRSKDGKEYQAKSIVVKSTFLCEKYGIQIPDIFGGNDNDDLGDAYKGACTDALTKIGSYLYVGMDVYKGKHHSAHKTEGKAPNRATTQPASNLPEEERPWLSEQQFNQLLKEINENKFDNYNIAMNKYRMKRQYREDLNKAVEFSKQLG